MASGSLARQSRGSDLLEGNRRLVTDEVVNVARVDAAFMVPFQGTSTHLARFPRVARLRR